MSFVVALVWRTLMPQASKFATPMQPQNSSFRSCYNITEIFYAVTSLATPVPSYHHWLRPLYCCQATRSHLPPQLCDFDIYGADFQKRPPTPVPSCHHWQKQWLLRRLETMPGPIPHWYGRYRSSDADRKWHPTPALLRLHFLRQRMYYQATMPQHSHNVYGRNR